MAEEIYHRARKKLSSENPNLNEIAVHIEDEARVLHESGYSKEASDLIRWARELRQKSTATGA